MLSVCACLSPLFWQHLAYIWGGFQRGMGGREAWEAWGQHLGGKPSRAGNCFGAVKRKSAYYICTVKPKAEANLEAPS